MQRLLESRSERTPAPRPSRRTQGPVASRGILRGSEEHPPSPAELRAQRRALRFLGPHGRRRVT